MLSAKVSVCRESEFVKMPVNFGKTIKSLHPKDTGFSSFLKYKNKFLLVHFVALFLQITIIFLHNYYPECSLLNYDLYDFCLACFDSMQEVNTFGYVKMYG